MIDKVIFDYGGVFTRSRSAFVANNIAESCVQREALLEFFASEFIRQAAEGKWSTEQVLGRLQTNLGNADLERIHQVFVQACAPDPRMVRLLQALRAHCYVFIISDSLPPYSDWLVREFSHRVDGMYLSDRLGARKSEGLFALAESTNPGLFAGSVYIDDRGANLPPAVSRGAIGLQFRSTEWLIEDLRALFPNFNVASDNR